MSEVDVIGSVNDRDHCLDHCNSWITDFAFLVQFE